MVSLFHTLLFVHLCNSLQDEMFQKFNFDTEWAVRLISKITNDEDMPIEGGAIVKQVICDLMSMMFLSISWYFKHAWRALS